MYLVLILRAEAVCLVILGFLFLTSRSYNIGKDEKTFSRLLGFALLHVIFDIITVLTVNNTGAVPSWVNRLCHIIFYLSAIFFSSELANYVFSICYPRRAKLFYALGHALAAIYLCCLPFLKIEYLPVGGTYASTGPAAIVGYGLAFIFFISALVIIFINLKILPGPIKISLIPMMSILM